MNIIRKIITAAAMLAGLSVSLQACEPGSGLQPDEKDSEMKITVSDGTHAVTFSLNGTPVAKSLYDQLPIEVKVDNYGSNEKIFTPPVPLSTSGGKEGECPVGTIAYFSPWKNIAMYHGKASRYPGLYLIGTAVEGQDEIRNLNGTIKVTKAE